jgi:hypothetical protein
VHGELQILEHFLDFTWLSASSDLVAPASRSRAPHLPDVIRSAGFGEFERGQ